MPNVILVTGLPGSGKTTLAREIATRFRVPLLGKDLIKEPLLDVLGAGDEAASRRLSDASFAVLFAVARELRLAGVHALLLEGNFRAGEHEESLAASLGLGRFTSEAGTVRLAQVLCEVAEPVREKRLAERASDPARHPGHRFGERSSVRIATMSRPTAGTRAFLDLPSERFTSDGANVHTVLDALDDWMNLRAVSPREPESSEPGQ